MSEGDTITAGSPLGTVGTWSDTLGRTELMIFGPDEVTGQAKAYCPFVFFDSSLINTYKAKVNTLMSEWEDFKSDTSIYNEAGMVITGCKYETMDG